MKNTFMRFRACRINTACFAALGLFAFPTIAAEQTQAEVASQWGLIGTWAISCEAPATRSNPFYTFAPEGKTLVVKRAMGDHNDKNEVISAKIIDKNEIEIAVEYKAYAKIMTARYLKLGSDTFSPLSNKDQTGLYTIKDRKQVKDGSPAPVMKHC